MRLPREFPPGADPSCPCVAKVSVWIAHVMGPESLWNKHLDRTPNEFLAGITEDGLCLRVDQSDAAFSVSHDHGVGCRLDHQTELFFGQLALSDVQ